MLERRINRTACRGLTTVELLVGLVVGLFISAGLLTMWLKLQTSTLNALAYARLNQDLRAITTVMANDIRRAGYRAWSPNSGIDITANPFMTSPNAIAIDRSDAGSMGRYEVSGKSAGDLPLLVQGHVQQKSRPRG